MTDCGEKASTLVSLRSNAIANYLSQGWETVISVLLIPVYIKLLGIESYGLIAFMSLLDVLVGVTNFGLTSTLTQYVARTSTGREAQFNKRDLVRTLEIAVTCLAGIGGCLIIVLSPIIADHWLDSQSIKRTTVIMSLHLMGCILCFRVISAFYEGGIKGMQKHVILGILRVAISFGMRVGSIAFVYYVSTTVQGLLLWQLVWVVLGAIALRTTLYSVLPESRGRPCFRWSIVRLTKRFTVGMFVFTLSALLVAQIDRFVASGMADLTMFAHYSLASTLAYSFFPLVYPLVTTIQPRLVQLLSVNDVKAAVALYHVSSQFLVIIVVPIAALLIVFPREVLSIWIRDSRIVEQAGGLLVPLAIASCISGLYHMAHAAQIASQKPQIGVLLNLTVGVGGSLLSVWSMHVLGIGWLAVTKCATIVLYVSVGIVLTHSLVLKGEAAKFLIYDVLLPSLGVMIVAVAARVAMPLRSSIWGIVLDLITVWVIVVFVAAMLAGEVRRRLRVHIMRVCAYMPGLR